MFGGSQKYAYLCNVFQNSVSVREAFPHHFFEIKIII